MAVPKFFRNVTLSHHYSSELQLSTRQVFQQRTLWKYSGLGYVLNTFLFRETKPIIYFIGGIWQKWLLQRSINFHHYFIITILNSIDSFSWHGHLTEFAKWISDFRKSYLREKLILMQEYCLWNVRKRCNFKYKRWYPPIYSVIVRKL